MQSYIDGQKIICMLNEFSGKLRLELSVGDTDVRTPYPEYMPESRNSRNGSWTTRMEHRTATAEVEVYLQFLHALNWLINWFNAQFLGYPEAGGQQISFI